MSTHDRTVKSISALVEEELLGDVKSLPSSFALALLDRGLLAFGYERADDASGDFEPTLNVLTAMASELKRRSTLKTTLLERLQTVLDEWAAPLDVQWVDRFATATSEDLSKRVVDKLLESDVDDFVEGVVSIVAQCSKRESGLVRTGSKEDSGEESGDSESDGVDSDDIASEDDEADSGEEEDESGEEEDEAEAAEDDAEESADDAEQSADESRKRKRTNELEDDSECDLKEALELTKRQR